MKVAKEEELGLVPPLYEVRDGKWILGKEDIARLCERNWPLIGWHGMYLRVYHELEVMVAAVGDSNDFRRQRGISHEPGTFLAVSSSDSPPSCYPISINKTRSPTSLIPPSEVASKRSFLDCELFEPSVRCVIKAILIKLIILPPRAGIKFMRDPTCP